MINQLSSLISGSVRRPIIINGKLVTTNGKMLFVRRDNYRIMFLTIGANYSEVPVDDGDDILEAYAKEFNEEFGSFVKFNGVAISTFAASIDPFTGAVILKNGLYTTLLDKNDALHLHDGMSQFQGENLALINKFVTTQIINYVEIFTALMSRRLMSSHTPMKIKGHLVSGLYQPLIVSSKGVDCPLVSTRFRWFLQYINRGNQLEEYLEGMDDTARGLTLSVIAMSDLQKVFGTRLVRNLNRVHFVFMMYLILIGTVDPSARKEMIKTHSALYTAIREGTAGDIPLRSFMEDFVTGVEHARTGLMAL